MREFMNRSIEEIERLQARVQELEQERAGILVTLDEVVKEAYLQEPFSDDAGMNLLHGASLLLKKMLPQPPQEEE